MLSNKWTFSLKILVMMVALAFVVTPAMAGEFDVVLEATQDVSAAPDFQMEHPGTSLVVLIESGQAITVAPAAVFVVTYDEDGNVLGFPTAEVGYIPATAIASRNITLTIPVTAATDKVNIKIAKGILSADPINDDMSKALDVNIFLVDDDDAGFPTIYSMRRADNPLLPATAATVQVIVTLSEEAKEFKKGNLSISDNATIADPVALDPIAEDPNRFGVLSRTLGRANPSSVPMLRGLYDGTNRAGDTGLTQADGSTATEGIHTAINAYAATTDLGMAIADYNAENTGSAAPSGGLYATDIAATSHFPVAVDDDSVDPNTVNYRVGTHRPLMTYTIGTGNAVTYPNTTSLAFAVDATADEIEEVIADIDTFPLDRSVAPTLPNPQSQNYVEALALYQVQKAVYDLYMDERAVYNAYMAAVMAERAADDTDLQAHYAAELGVDLVPTATGRDDMLHPYVVTITPKYPAGKPDIVLKIGAWEDTTLPISNKYIPPRTDREYEEGIEKLTIKVGKEDPTALAEGIRLNLPHGDGAMIPASGFYLLTKNKDGSGINYSHPADAENKAHLQNLAQLLFNVRALGIPNLETFLLNGGTLDLVAYDGTAATAAYISEVMWGTDASQSPTASNSQWIEIANTTAAPIAIAENKWALWVYQANETPPTTYTDTDGTTAGVLIDRLSTVRADWTLAGKGQGGRTNVDPGGADVVAIAPTKPLISMVRVTSAAGTPANGSLPTSWVASTGPSVNFKLGIEGTRIATPGAADVKRTPAPTPPTPALPVAKGSDIMITEIMVDADNGRLPQWIELTHVGTGEVSLDGWEMVIDNAIDADVIGGGNAITISLSGATLDVSAHTGNTGKGQSVLVVAWAASRKSANIRADRIINVATQLNQKRQYQLLSYKGFRITLVPPQVGAIAAFGDVAGNLDEAWEIMMDEGAARSSMIRREMAGTPVAATMGTDANGWVLASSTPLITGQQSYYGSDEDSGTPGQDAGGPLPVELSHFRPARDKTTGAVVITWLTQSELNNAGFFIKRSQQRNGQFKVINATLIAGAGTTSEKQFYTYTDTTAQPNVVYYYQIEDVSLDGNRQQLTNGIRLKGHIGAAGKATLTWGELKSSNQ